MILGKAQSNIVEGFREVWCQTFVSILDSRSRTIWGQKRVKRTNTEAVKHVIINVSNALVIQYLMRQYIV